MDMFHKILIRFGEISLKGKNKINFINKLAQNIKETCCIKHSDMEINIDRIFIPYSEQNLEKLNYVFGISSFSPVIKTTSTIEDIKNVLLNLSLSEYKTFKINSKRKWKEFPKTSLDLNFDFGGLILKNFSNLSVKVKDPDIEINIEIHHKYSYIFWKKINGLGGLPVGVSGKSLHLLSGGIDSPVAALEMMKRGVKVDFLSFISPPHTDQTTIDKLKMLVSEINKYQISSKLYFFNYTEIMNYIGLTSNQSYKIILMRRSFYRIASQIANQNHCLGISNGENLGQVASQTMEAMNVIHDACSIPVYQPLLTNDKIETIKLSQKFNLFPISIIKACETCELFAPDAPATKPKLEIASKLEEELDMLKEMEEKAIKTKIEKINIKLS